FARCDSLVLGGWRSMTTALSGQQMTLPISVGVYSCSSFGHSAWLILKLGDPDSCCPQHHRDRHRKNVRQSNGIWKSCSDTEHARMSQCLRRLVLLLVVACENAPCGARRTRTRACDMHSLTSEPTHRRSPVASSAPKP